MWRVRSTASSRKAPRSEHILVHDETRLPLESVITTPVLSSRPSRSPDYAVENAALVFLMNEIGHSPGTILQTLVDTALKVCRAESAGISILEEENGAPLFRWHAVAGLWSRFVGGTMPRGMSPCGVVIDRNASLLLEKPERHFPIPDELQPRIEEVLLIPFHSDAKPVGTLWVVAHDGNRQFDAEDERLLTSLARFASVAHGRLTSLDEEKARLVEEIQAEAAIRRRAAPFETLLNEAPLGVYVVDQDFRISAVNPLTLAVFGDLPDVIGRDFDEVVHILWPKEYADEVSSRFRHTLETGEPYLAPERIEQRRDLGATQVYEWQISRIPLPDGRHGVVCYFRDITQSVRNREALRESEQRLRFVLDSMPQKVFTADTTGAVTYFNRQWSEFTGLTFEQIRDWGWTEFIHPDDLEENTRVWKHAVETGEPLLFDHRFRGADGEYRWHSSRVAPMRDADGRIIMWIGSNTDIDDVMRTREALEEASRRKDEFLATVSHELRTPMTSILGWTALMTMCSLDEPTQREGIDSIHRSALAQAELIDDILDVARVMTGKLHLTIEPLDLNGLVRAAIAVVVPAADAKELKIEFALFEQDLPSISGDATRLQQVAWNLLSNAVKFTPVGGTITVRVFSDDALVHVVVRDTGIGIHPDFLPYAFDRFAQQEVGAGRRHGGLGIGLAVVKQLVELHGGTVSVSSEGEGQGSVFTVSFPVRERRADRAATAAGVAPGEASPPEPLPSIDNLRLLLIDDSGEARRTIAAILRQFGAKVTEASTAAEALALFGSDRFDLLICDVAMPGEDGYSFIRRIRAEEEASSRTPAMAFTAFGRPSEEKIALDHGFDLYLQKPVEPDALIRRIATTATKGS